MSDSAIPPIYAREPGCLDSISAKFRRTFFFRRRAEPVSPPVMFTGKKRDHSEFVSEPAPPAPAVATALTLPRMAPKRYPGSDRASFQLMMSVFDFIEQGPFPLGLDIRGTRSNSVDDDNNSESEGEEASSIARIEAAKADPPAFDVLAQVREFTRGAKKTKGSETFMQVFALVEMQFEKSDEPISITVGARTSFEYKDPIKVEKNKESVSLAIKETFQRIRKVLATSELATVKVIPGQQTRTYMLDGQYYFFGSERTPEDYEDFFLVQEFKKQRFGF